MSFRPLTENYVAVATIPTKVVSIPTKSEAIDRLLKKREKSHRSVIESLKFQCQKHNAEIEEEIRTESELLKDDLEIIKMEIETELKKILRNTDDELLLLSSDDFQSVSTVVQDLHERRLQRIDLFVENVKVSELKRSNFFREVFREAYKEASKISHVLPYDLLNFFEEEIMRLNAITMDNHRSYAKTQADLKLRMEEHIRIVLLKIVDVKDRHKMAVEMAKVKVVMGSFKDAELPVPELDTFDTHLPLSPRELEMWSKQTHATMDRLDTNARKLVNLYRMAVMHIFNRFFEELSTLTGALVAEEEPMEFQNPDLECSNPKVYQELVEDLTQLYACDIAELQTMWDAIAHNMEDELQNTHRFLDGSAHLWDAHFARMSQSKCLILKDLDVAIQKHDKEAYDFDKKVNTTLDKLREDSHVKKLVEHLHDANKFLDSIGRLYSSQCNDEIKILRKYHDLMDQDIGLLMSEIERFLDVTASNDGIQARRSDSSINFDTKVTDSDETLIPHQIKTTQYQVDAVNNWMFGLWEAIRHYLGACHAELSNQTDIWLESIISKLKKRLEVRLATHNPRYARIKALLYEVRLKEIEDHMEELHRVEENTKRHIGDSASFNQMAKEARASTLKSYEKKLKEIEEKLRKATRSQHVAAYAEQTKTAAREALAELNENFRENDELLKQNRNNIDRVICQFSTSIRLFSEGGNYSRDEAKHFKKKIHKVKKGVAKKYHKLAVQYDGVKNETVRKFGQSEAAILARLDLCKKEFEHVEKTCAKIKDLQHEIRSMVYKVKFKIHRIDAAIDYYSEMSKFELWKRKNFEIMKDVVGDCLQKAQEMEAFLRDGYVRNVEEVIDRSFEEIGEMSKIFYANHGPIIYKEKISGTFGGFMAEVKKNYDGFRKQVQVDCLECVQELSKHVLKFLKVNDDVYAGLVRRFPKITRGRDEEQEEIVNLSVELSEESLRLERKKRSLEGSGAAIAEEILDGNEDRVNVLRSLISKLMERLREEIIIFENGGEDETEEEEDEENVAEADK